MHAYGIMLPKGLAKFRQAVVEKLDRDKDNRTVLGQELFWKSLNSIPSPKLAHVHGLL